MNHKKLRAIAIVCFVACGVGSYAVYASTVKIHEAELYPVVSIMDGDTFKAKIGRHIITVRMLGIDTPETVDPRKPEQCFGKEASNETRLLLTGNSVRLKLNPNREEKDKYGRYLAYVYRDDDLFVNEFLLKNGYAREYTYGKAYVMQKEFREVEAEAKKAKKGMWGECPILTS
jgi:micrococcal nuclease